MAPLGQEPCCTILPLQLPSRYPTSDHNALHSQAPSSGTPTGSLLQCHGEPLSLRTSQRSTLPSLSSLDVTTLHLKTPSLSHTLKFPSPLVLCHTGWKPPPNLSSLTHTMGNSFKVLHPAQPSLHPQLALCSLQQCF